MISLTTREINIIVEQLAESAREIPEIAAIIEKLERELHSPARTYLEHTLYTRLDSDSSQ